MMTNPTNTTPENNPAPASRQVRAINAWGWTVQGFYLFKANPVMWIILILIYLLIMVPLSMLPGVGSFLSALLAPVFAAGLMWAAQAVSRGEELEINHLFLGFKRNTAQLVSVGGFYMLSLIAIAVFVVMSLDKTVVELLVQGKELSVEQANTVVMPALIALALLVPVVMAYWFAPVLVGLHHLKATEAIKLSFMASVRNIFPFFLYGFIFAGLVLLALIPFGLGLIIVVPVMMTSLYASYADIFNIPKSADVQVSETETTP